MYFIAIPVILGLTIGFFLLTNDNNIDQEPAIFTKDKLLENSPPIIGDKTAKITILEFGDYQCTFCHKFHQQTFGEIKKSYIDTGKVNFTYKDLPVNGMASVLAAEASFCAEDQNKYWEYHNLKSSYVSDSRHLNDKTSFKLTTYLRLMAKKQISTQNLSSTRLFY